jgi:hypothetical protein
MGGRVWGFGVGVVVRYAPILAVCAAVLYECVELGLGGDRVVQVRFYGSDTYSTLHARKVPLTV